MSRLFRSRRILQRGEVRRTVVLMWRPDFLDSPISVECYAKHASRILKALRAEFRREAIAERASRAAFERAHRIEREAMRKARAKIMAKRKRHKGVRP